MSGIFGIVSIDDCLEDVFFGTDFQSHLGTKYGGMAVFRERIISSIGDISSTQFKGVFEEKLEKFKGGEGAPPITAAIGVISDGEPQPLTYRLNNSDIAIVTNGNINNLEKLASELAEEGRLIAIEDVQPQKFCGVKNVSNQTNVVASLITKGATIPEGIDYMRSKIDGAISLAILHSKNGSADIWFAADEYNNNSFFLGEKEGSFAVATSSTAFSNLKFKLDRKLAPGEIMYLTSSGPDENKSSKGDSNKSEPCIFYDIYTEFPSSQGPFDMSAEEFRYKAGGALAKRDKVIADLNFGVADSGIGHMIGFNNQKVLLMHELTDNLLALFATGKVDTSEFGDAIKKVHEASLELSPINRALVKYTPSWGRSYQPSLQKIRDFVGYMKQVPIPGLIDDKVIRFYEDSIVRGTQLKQMISKLTDYGAKELHARVGSPILLDSCPFNRSTKERRELQAWSGIASLEGIPFNDDGKPSYEIESVPQELVMEYSNPKTDKYEKLVDWVKDNLRLNTLMYLHPNELLEITGRESNQMCRQCFGYKSQRK